MSKCLLGAYIRAGGRGVSRQSVEDGADVVDETPSENGKRTDSMTLTDASL